MTDLLVRMAQINRRLVRCEDQAECDRLEGELVALELCAPRVTQLCARGMGPTRTEGAHVAKLTTKERKALPTKDFAGPGRSFPIEDKKHARAAIMDGAKGATLAKAKAKLRGKR